MPWKKSPIWSRKLRTWKIRVEGKTWGCLDSGRVLKAANRCWGSHKTCYRAGWTWTPKGPSSWRESIAPKHRQNQTKTQRFSFGFCNFKTRSLSSTPPNSAALRMKETGCSSHRTSQLRQCGSGMHLIQLGKCLGREGLSVDSSKIRGGGSSVVGRCTCFDHQNYLRLYKNQLTPAVLQVWNDTETQKTFFPLFFLSSFYYQPILFLASCYFLKRHCILYRQDILDNFSILFIYIIWPTDVSCVIGKLNWAREDLCFSFLIIFVLFH